MRAVVPTSPSGSRDPRQRGRLIALIVDAGPLYAYVDRDDRHHAACLDLLETHPGPLIVPTLVITEVRTCSRTRLGVDAEIRFLGDLAAGNLIGEPVAAADWMRIAELVGRYRDLPLGTVDASVISAAERLGSTEIATLDRRHFTVVQSNIGILNLLHGAAVLPTTRSRTTSPKRAGPRSSGLLRGVRNRDGHSWLVTAVMRWVCGWW